MFGLKKQLIKSFIKLSVIENKPNSIKIRINRLEDLAPEYRIYEKEIIEAIQLLQGIEEVVVSFEEGIITIKYNDQKLSPQTIFYWLQLIIDVGLDNLEFIEKYAEKDIERVRNYLRPILESKVQMYNR